MKKITKRRIFNLTLLCVFYAGCFYGGFVAPWENTASQGGALGIAIGIPLVFLILVVLTVYYTRKYGGDWAKVRSNLKHNLWFGFGFTWKDKK